MTKMLKASELVEMGFELSSKRLESTSASHYTSLSGKKRSLLNILLNTAGFKNKINIKTFFYQIREGGVMGVNSPKIIFLPFEHISTI